MAALIAALLTVSTATVPAAAESVPTTQAAVAPPDRGPAIVGLAGSQDNAKAAGHDHDGYASITGVSEAPSVSSFTATPSTLTSAGGSVSLSANVTNAISCKFSSNKTLMGLPVTVACADSTVVIVPPNMRKRAAKYKFELSVTGTKIVKAKEVTVSVGAYCDPGPDAYLVRCKFTRANLAGADLSGANLSGADLTGANLSGANLSGADLAGANLTGANLSGVTSGGIIGTPTTLPTSWLFVTGYLIGPEVNLAGADLAGANLSGGDLAGANISGANLTGANLGNVASGGTTGTPASLPANWLLVAGYLIGPAADLSGANLSDANLTGADLRGANLADSNLAGVNLTNVDLTGVRSGGIIGTPASLPPNWKLYNGYLVGPGS